MLCLAFVDGVRRNVDSSAPESGQQIDVHELHVIRGGSFEQSLVYHIPHVISIVTIRFLFLSHYSWILTNLALHEGGWALIEKCQLWRFFPLPKTPAVRRRLRMMFLELSDHLGWPLDVI